jgi:hypothetical protein
LLDKLIIKQANESQEVSRFSLPIIKEKRIRKFEKIVLGPTF